MAFVLVHVDDSGGEVVDWVMSCRTMNRTLEYAVESKVEQILVNEGVSNLRATYRPTAKNVPVANLFTQFGFTEVAHTETETSYACFLPRTMPLAHQFIIKGE